MSAKASRREIVRALIPKLVADEATRSHWIQVLAAYILQENLIEDAELIINDIAHELFEQEGILSVSVTSATDLTEELRESLRRYLIAQTGATSITMSESIDAHLLGGLIARTPDGELDISVRRQLQQLGAIA